MQKRLKGDLETEATLDGKTPWMVLLTVQTNFRGQGHDEK